MNTWNEIQPLAHVALGSMIQGTRDNGESYWFANVGDHWINDLCGAAHDDREILPDDHRYQFIVDTLNLIEDYDNESEAREQINGSEVTHETTSWLASSNMRVSYLQDALTEYGEYNVDAYQMLRYAMREEQAEVFTQVVSFLTHEMEVTA